MSASLRISRRQLLLALGALVLAVVVVVVAVVALRSDADPVAGGTTSASPTASSGAEAEPSPGEDEPGEGDQGEPGDAEPSEGDSSKGDPADQPDAGDDETAVPEPRKTLEPAEFGDKVTPEPGVTVAVPKVEEVTGEANIPGEVGGPALRFTVDVTNGTGKTLDLRTVVVNAYYGPDRTPASPLLKPGGKAFDSEVDNGGTARGVFVFNVPAEFQDKVELEIDPRIDAPIAIFTGA
jgi:hypothetical protein